MPQGALPLMLLAATLVWSPAQATVFRYIDGKNTTIDPYDNYSLVDNGVKYRTTSKGQITPPWISSHGFKRSTDPNDRAVGLKIKANEIGDGRYATTTNNYGANKIEYNIIRHTDPASIKFGQDRFVGFAIKLDRYEFQPPEDGKWLIVAQWWQGSPHSPPFEMSIEPDVNPNNPTIRYRIGVKHDGNTPPSLAEGKYRRVGGGDTLFEGTMVRNRYYTFVFKTNFSYNGDGRGSSIRVWRDGVALTPLAGMQVNPNNPTEYTGDCGFTPREEDDYYWSVDDQFAPKVTLYRPVMNRVQQVYYDEIRYGTSYNEVDPGGSVRIAIDNAKYKLFVRHSGKVLKASGTTNGSTVVQDNDSAATDRQWNVTLQSNGYYKILSVPSGKGLDVYRSGTNDFDPIQLWSYWGNPNQEWLIEPTEEGYCYVVPRHSGRPATVQNNSTTAGAPVVQYRWGILRYNSHWKFIKLP
jgi:hypothetical protein